MQSYEKALKADPSYTPAAECLAIVLTDIGTSLKLAGNTQEGIQKYYEAIKIDSHYAVINSTFQWPFLLCFPWLYHGSPNFNMLCCICSLLTITLALYIQKWCNTIWLLIAMRRLHWSGPCMLKLIAIWVLYSKIVGIWSLQLLVMRGCFNVKFSLFNWSLYFIWGGYMICSLHLVTFISVYAYSGV